MNIIAIDVSKDTLDILSGKSPQDSLHEKIANTPEALEQYLARQQYTPEQWTVVMESTGDYHRTPAIFFLEKGFCVKVLNPLLTNQFTRATIRKIKTDKTDAEKIMKLGFAGEGDVVSLDQFSNITKELLRLSHFLTKLKTKLKLKSQSLDRKKLIDQGTEDELQELMERIQDIIERVDTNALEEENSQREYIDSIPGFSAKLSQIVLSECGDITRFKDAKALVAYAGLDPKVKQSGSSLHSFGRLTKRGSDFLRYALFLAARVAWRYDPELYNYYQKKRAEGRSFTETICMIARKLLHRIYVVVNEQRPYVLRSSHPFPS